MYTPSNPTFIKKNWGLQGYTYCFLIFAQNIDCGYTLEPPQIFSTVNFHFLKSLYIAWASFRNVIILLFIQKCKMLIAHDMFSL